MVCLALSTVAWIGAGWLLATCVALAFVIPLLKAAKRADLIEELGEALRPRLDRLTEVRAPSGRPFFPAPEARDELEDELQELAMTLR